MSEKRLLQVREGYYTTADGNPDMKEIVYLLKEVSSHFEFTGKRDIYLANKVRVAINELAKPKTENEKDHTAPASQEQH